MHFIYKKSGRRMDSTARRNICAVKKKLWRESRNGPDIRCFNSVSGRIFVQFGCIRRDFWPNRRYLAELTIFGRIFGQIEGIRSDIGKLDGIRRDIRLNRQYSARYLSNSTVFGGVFGQID